MTADQITHRRAVIAAERAALEAELARREAREMVGLLFLTPGVPLTPSELKDFHLSHPTEKSS